jgi:hypothetical protein
LVRAYERTSRHAEPSGGRRRSTGPAGELRDEIKVVDRELGQSASDPPQGVDLVSEHVADGTERSRLGDGFT